MNLQRLSHCAASVAGVIYAETQKALCEDQVFLCDVIATKSCVRFSRNSI